MTSLHKDPRLLEVERQNRRSIRTSLIEWARFALAPLGQQPARHHIRLIDELTAISAGDCDRLMVLMPPGSAKSTYASVLFPVWWFTQHPASAVIAASHTADLGAHFGRQVRNLIAEHDVLLGYSVARDKRAAGRWQTTRKGNYHSVGVRGPIVGRRADLVLIDDPVKSQAEADSVTHRDHVWAWYRSDLITRLKPGGRIVLIMTRWHEDDLGGRILRNPEGWRCLSLPALAEADDPLGRSPGDPLWPEWEGHDALARKRAAIGERAWAALFQQQPRPLNGGLFRIERIATREAPPASIAVAVRAWDLAATAHVDGHDPDWTVGVKLLREASGSLIVADVVRLRGGPGEVEEAIVNTAQRDGVSVAVGLPQDPGQAGRAQVLYLTRRLAGYRVVSSAESGAKATRAMPIASQCDGGNLAVVRGIWNAAFLDELQAFPNGSKDDQVDALSRAFGMVIEPAAPARNVRFSLLAR
jgi:predicted phage terminase large subunit-like protein